MKKQALIGLTALLMSCAKTYNSPEATYNTPEAKVELARCLVKEEATMYGAEWCGYCQKEIKEFGPAWDILKKNYVECPADANLCEEIAVNGEVSLPTWKFRNGKVVRGYAPNFLEILAKESGCD